MTRGPSAMNATRRLGARRSLALLPRGDESRQNAGMWVRAVWALGLAIQLLSPRNCIAGIADGVERSLREATVLVGSGCSGVLIDGPDLVLTAAHCIGDRSSVDLRFAGGAFRTGWVGAIDHVADQALLLLEEPVALRPLRLTPRDPIAGSIVYFGGRPSQPSFQEATIQRVGRCPSLPQLPNAVFTTIKGIPGDSGAPIVDGTTRLIGIVHGGAQCEIITPANTARRLIERLLEENTAAQAPAMPRLSSDGPPGP